MNSAAEVKHTPGPWFAHEPINANRRDFGVTAGRPYNPSTGAVRRIAWVGNSSNQNNHLADENRANARLIAAAPELLAEVKRFRDTIAYFQRGGKPSTDEEGMRMQQLTLNMLDDLIARATQPAA